MNAIQAVGLSVFGLLAALIFFVVHSEHRAEYQKGGLQHEKQIERFDRDFEKAWNGETLTDPDRAKRLEALEVKEREMKEKEDADTADRKKREEQLHRALEQFPGSPTKKGQPQ